MPRLQNTVAAECRSHGYGSGAERIFPPREDRARFAVQQQGNALLPVRDGKIIVVFISAEQADAQLSAEHAVFLHAFKRLPLRLHARGERFGGGEGIFVLYRSRGERMGRLSVHDAHRHGTCGEGVHALREGVVAVRRAEGRLSAPARFAFADIDLHVARGRGHGGERRLHRFGHRAGNAVVGVGVLAFDAREREGELLRLRNKEIAAHFGKAVRVVVRRARREGGQQGGGCKNEKRTFFHGIMNMFFRAAA